MEIKGIKYISPLFDGSGYAKASRGNIMALRSLGVPLTLSPISFEKIHPDLGQEGEILKSLVNKEIDYNIVLIHTTPEFWERHKEPGKTMLGYTIWETSKLHPKWPGYINTNADKILVGSEWNVGVFRSSGVKVPIGVIPHGIDTGVFEDVSPFPIGGVGKDTYVFYDIFQWTERKNPLPLIKAYWYAFNDRPDANVALVLKTYRGDYSIIEKDTIRTSLHKFKEVAPLDYYPPIFLITNLLSEAEIHGLHARGDCFVSLNRGEGFGLSPFTAGACGKPVIITGYGGATEYAKEDNSYLLDYVLSPTFGMPWSVWYRGDQLWAEPDAYQAAKFMQHVYENKEEAKERGQRLKKYISENFTWNDIGKRIIEEIHKL